MWDVNISTVQVPEDKGKEKGIGINGQKHPRFDEKH